jgi:hypothetical protein
VTADDLERNGNFKKGSRLETKEGFGLSWLTQCGASSKTAVLPDPLLQKAIDYHFSCVAAPAHPPWLSDQHIHPNVFRRPQSDY